MLEHNTSLSSAQKRIWFDCQSGDPIRNHLALVYELRGDFSPIVMQQALAQLVEKHDAFRMTIFSANQNLERVVHETIRAELKNITLDNTADHSEIYRRIHAIIAKPFNLSAGPLFRFTVLKKNPEENYLVLVFHRMIVNFCSLKKIMTEVSRFYQEGYQGKETSIQTAPSYGELVAYEKKEREKPEYRETVRHWSNRIKDKQFHLDLSRLPETEENLPLYRSERLTLDEKAVHELHDCSQRFSCNTEMILLTALQVLLQRYSDNSDVIIKRREEVYYQDDWKDMLGPMGNILPWNVRLQKNMSFLDLMIKNKQLNVYKKYYPHCHIADLVRTIRSRFNNHFDGLFTNVIFDREYWPFHELQLPNVFSKLMPHYMHRTGTEDLQIFYSEHAGKIYLTFDYSQAISSRAIQPFVEHYKNLLVEILRDPAQLISKVNFFSAEELARLVGNVHANIADKNNGMSIVDYFEQCVKNHPNNIALVDEKIKLTYLALNQLANQLARCIQEQFKLTQERELKADDRIGLAVGRNVRMVVATLSILKSGAAYVPLDPSYPKERLAYMMQDADIKLVITEKDIEAFIQSFPSIIAILLDENLDVLTTFSKENLAKKPQLGDLAYIIYTSGSTGNPKGVLVEHRGLPNLAHHQNQLFPIHDKTRCLQTGSINFDITALELYGPLIIGATLYIASHEQRMAPQKLQQYIIENNIQIVVITPSVLAHFEWRAMPDVTAIVACGEACEQKLMDYWAHGRTFVNGYGPTEITIISHFKKYEPNTAFNNLGPTIPNVTGYLLDADLNPVPNGVTGELYIGGIGVTRGYLNLPTQTAEKFIHNPFSNNPQDIIYRSNDIAYRLENGDFIYLGRNDAQVKIRGLRVELGEIEEKIKAYPDVERVLVRVLKHESLGQVLIAYYVQNSFKKPIEENALRGYLKSVLPEHMVPSYLMKITYVPIMRNGKIDYQALPNPFSVVEHFNHENCGKIENYLLTIFAELFKIDEKTLSLEHDFFALGGHSLLATQMIARIRQHLKLTLPVNKVFELRTIKQLAEYLVTLKEVSIENLSLKRCTNKTTAPLSYSQQLLWFVYQLDKNSSLYNIPFLIHLKNSNVEYLMKSLRHLVEENSCLRTVFQEATDEPVQKVLKKIAFDIPVYESLDIFYHDIDLFDKQPFDLMHGPLFRLAIAESDDEILLYFNIHHIIFDGWSLKIFVEQLGRTYAILAAAENSNAQPMPHFSTEYAYGDYAFSQHQWIKEEKLADELGFWQHFLQGAPPSLELPTDFPYPKQRSYQGDIVRITLQKPLVNDLKALALENKTTLFSVLLTAYFILLYRYTKQDDIVIGTPIAGRHQAAFEKIMGFFVNVSIYRQQLSNTKSFNELLQSVHQNACDAADHQTLPFDVLLNSLNVIFDPKQNPLFQVLFSLQTGHQLSGTLPGTSVSYHMDERHAGGAKMDLILLLNEMSDGTLRGYVEYRTDLFTEASMQHLATHYVNLLQAIVNNSSAPMAELSILSYEESQLLVRTWPYGEKKPVPTKTVMEMIEEIAEKHFNQCALVYQDKKLTYGEFIQRVNILAQKIIFVHSRENERIDDIIGIFLPRGLEMIIAMCAISKAGAAFLPLDPDYPEDRLRYMLEDSGAKTIVSISTLKDKQSIFLDHQPINVIQMNELSNENVKISTQPLNFPVLSSTAYIIYTSGSTGQPKGVELEHSGLSNLVVYLHELYQLQMGSRVLQFYSINFDASMAEIFSTLSSGGCLYIADNDIRYSVPHLQNYIEKQKIQVVAVAPALLENFDKKTLSALKTIILGGDICETNTINFWQQQCRLINAYGPTEATVISTVKVYKKNDAQRNIGRPLYNTEIFILDEDLNPVPTGVPGEIFIGGAGLARGYLNRESLTLERFILHPFSDDPEARLYKTGDYARWLSNGDLDFIGRVDNQVKIRGYRIEMGEIEVLLNAYSGINQAVVIAKKEEQCLVAYVSAHVSDDEKTTLPEKLRLYLFERLPEYMIPSAFILLDTLPLSLSGKIDRKALQEKDFKIFYHGRALMEPRTEMEKILLTIWKEILKMEQIGIDHSFFELGGHSLLITQMVSRIKKILKLNLSVIKVFELRTIQKLAEYLCTLYEESKNNLLLMHLPQKTSGKITAPLSYGQKQMWFFYQLDKKASLYNIPFVMRFKKAEKHLLEKALHHVIAQNAALRTVIDDSGDEPVQHVLEKIQTPIPFYDSLDAFYQDIALWNKRAFDLIQGPLFRFAMTEDKTDVLVYFNVHHIAFDGWSTNILMSQIVKSYAALEKNQTLPEFITEYQYVDYAYSQNHWIEENKLADQLDFWKNFLQDAQTTLDLPTDFPYPKQQNFQGKTVEWSLPKTLVENLKIMALEHQTTVFAVLLAAYFALLYRYTKQSDMIIGSPIAGRYQAALEPLIGFFVNEVIYCQQLSNTQSFRELLKSVHQNACDAADNQILPFNEILEKLNVSVDPKKNPLFQVMFSYQPAALPTEDNTLLSYLIEDQNLGCAKLDMSLLLREMADGTIQGAVEYRTDLFTEMSMQHVCTHYTNLLQEIITKPDASLGSFSILSQEEYQILIHTWPYGEKKSFSEKMTMDRIEAIAKEYPDNSALVFQDKIVTYEELLKKINALANAIRSVQKTTTEDLCIIGIFMPRGIEMIIAMCAIWKTGAAFLPLDAEYPEERLRYMLEDSHSKLIMSVSELKDKQGVFINDSAIIQADEVLNDVSRWPAKENHTILSRSPAYIIYTSGSTGNPKGVVIEHQGLNNLVVSLQDLYQLHPGMRLLQFLSICFDASISEIFPALASGACLYIADTETRRSVPHLQDYIEQKKIQLLAISPAIFEHFEKRPMPNLKMVVVGGDVCDMDTITYWQQQCRFMNVYGPTEATVTVTSKIFSEAEKSSAKCIGRPLYHTEIFILDEALNPSPTGVTGEIFIGGMGLARGYLYRDDLTQEKFISHPFSSNSQGKLYRTGDYGRWLPNGDIEFVGRMDNQVKIRGYRIEIGEIEVLLNAYPAIKQAVVIAKKDQQCLVVYFSVNEKNIVNVDDQDISEQLHTYLSRQLPEYMVPSAFIQLDTLPLNLSGKIDRKALQTKDFRIITRIKAIVEPRNAMENNLLEIWKEVLKMDQIGIEHSFFDLGGHSLLASRVSSRFKARYAMECPVSVIFQYKTIAAIVEYLQNADQSGEVQIKLMDEDIQRAKILLKPIKGYSPDLPKHILMTGGHGFLGSHMLLELLKETQATITCLVRANSLDDLRNKVKQDLARFNLAYLSENSRIHWVIGDLSLPQLGLDSKIYQQLCEQVDSIYHSGAWVNHILNYENLRISNVESTIELLKMASTHSPKMLNYISTTSLETVTRHPEQLEHMGGYIQSKWASEKILLNASQHGFDVRIFRAGNITGHSQTGISVVDNNHAMSLVKCCIQLGITPDWIFPVEMMPVDLLSRAIVKLSLLKKANRMIWSLNNIQDLSWKNYMDYLNQLGFNIRTVPFIEWQAALKTVDEDTPLFAFKAFYTELSPEDVMRSEENPVFKEDVLRELGLEYPTDYQALVNLYWKI